MMMFVGLNGGVFELLMIVVLCRMRCFYGFLFLLCFGVEYGGFVCFVSGVMVNVKSSVMVESVEREEIGVSFICCFGFVVGVDVLKVSWIVWWYEMIGIFL